MTREEAARVLHPDTCRKESVLMNADDWWEMYWEARRMGAEALMPWVRTADRAPGETDADINGHVAWVVKDKKGRPFVDVNHWSLYDPEDAPWWMPIPPLPPLTEVEQ